MTEEDYDVVVIGAGIGGIYGVHHFHEAGFKVLGLEGAPEVGGTWYHNCYPGARVDVESTDYSYVDPSLYREWRWSERYAAQPEILRYLNWVADRWDVRRHFRFETWMTGARWHPEEDRYVVSTTDGVVRTRFLIMAAGQLSRSRTPDFEGLSDFKGEVYKTSHWPHEEVELAGKRIALIGTGSSGVQTATAVAKIAEHLFVFQRTPHYSMAAQNRKVDPEYLQERLAKADEYEEILSNTHLGMIWPPFAGRAADFTPDEQQKLLEEAWLYGGPSFNSVFMDTATNLETNFIVAEFVRNKIRSIVKDQSVAEKMLPDYPIATRRPIYDTGYYEIFNQDNVTLVDGRATPIVRFNEHGIETATTDYEVDVVILAIGFEAFYGAIESANITNPSGLTPIDMWSRGPRTYLGLMTCGFPNLFFLTGPGSPSVVANMNLGNTLQIKIIATMLSEMKANGHTRVEPSEKAQDEWTLHCAEAADLLVSFKQRHNWLVHRNEDDGTSVFIPYTGGLPAYVRRCREVVDTGYEGFQFA